MRFNNLNDWLDWQESLNPKEIDLGLGRVTQVLQRSGRATNFDCPLITVAGTNGKGSVVAMLEAMVLAAGLKVCSYTSPHISHYNERIRIDGQPIDDARLCQAFDFVDQARRQVSGEELPLTYFEFGTLAAIEIFFRQQPDIVILEVGLGGRLDAVNIMDADVSILTSVAIDHVDWLGDDRESIGFEKAGIFRPGKPAICGDADPPESVLQQAKKLHCQWLQPGRDFRIVEVTGKGSAATTWQLESRFGVLDDLPTPSLAGGFQQGNAATAILALLSLQENALLRIRLARQASTDDALTAVAEKTVLTDAALSDAIRSGLKNIKLPGRFEKLRAAPAVYVDVAHNPQAAQALSRQLQTEQERYHQTWAIMAMLADKDIKRVVEKLDAYVDVWCLAGLDNIARGLSTLELVRALSSSNTRCDEKVLTTEFEHESLVNQCTMLSGKVMFADTVSCACQSLFAQARSDDRIIIFGSFYAVAEATQFFSASDKQAGIQ